MNIMSLSILFAIGVFSHVGFLIFAKKYRARTERFRLKLWILHTVFNGILWVLIIMLMIAAQFSFAHGAYPLAIRILGIAFLGLGTLLVAKSYLLLGMRRVMGSRFFFPEETAPIRSSLYRFLNNPMYDGFMLITLGVGLWLGIREDMYLAGMIFVLLNIFLAAVENYKFTTNPF